MELDTALDSVDDGQESNMEQEEALCGKLEYVEDADGLLGWKYDINNMESEQNKRGQEDKDLMWADLAIRPC